MITVGIVGPESTGKTTLAKGLAKHFKTNWVPEYAREFLSNLDRAYQKEDLIEIARGQLASESDKSDFLDFRPEARWPQNRQNETFSTFDQRPAGLGIAKT